MIEKVKAYIHDNGIKQKFLAEKVGMSEVAFCDFLAGRRNLTADEYVKLCRLKGGVIDAIGSRDCSVCAAQWLCVRQARHHLPGGVLR